MTARTIQPSRALAQMRRGQLRIVDIRARHERLTGTAAGAESADDRPLRSLISELTDRDAPPAIALLCERGVRSARAAEELRAHAAGVFSIAGGMQAWRAEGLPVELPDSDLALSERTRYLRHLALPDIGEAGQLRLKRSRVLIVGAGGLGSPAALYLAGAGIGRLGLVDDDRVELSNLQRQILHDETRVGQRKVDSARARLEDLNRDIEIETHAVRLGPDSAERIVGDFDLVIDGSDNFPTRYLLNDVCIRLGKPLIYGAIERFSGQVGVFRAGDGTEPCYRCLFPQPPAPGEAPGCAEAGVFGVLPGVIGTLQAVEALKLVLDKGTPLIGQVLFYDALEADFRRVRIARDPACRWCDPRSPLQEYPDYARFCTGS